MNRLSDVQFSRFTETEVAKLLTVATYACDPSEVAGRIVKFLRAQEGHKLAAGRGVGGSISAQPGTILIARAA